METGNISEKGQIFKYSLSWVSIILSGISIVFLMINVIDGLIFNSFHFTNGIPDEMKINPDNYKISGLIIFAMIVAVCFFSAFIVVSVGFLKQKPWSGKYMYLYLWFFTVLLPIIFLLYWAAAKDKLSKMNFEASNNPEMIRFYETANLALNIRLIFLGIVMLVTVVLLIRANSRIGKLT
ncbi:MAG: hypothetical protein ACM3PT_04245 [Deltaproteobacteria bacterium]